MRKKTATGVVEVDVDDQNEVSEEEIKTVEKPKKEQTQAQKDTWKAKLERQRIRDMAAYTDDPDIIEQARINEEERQKVLKSKSKSKSKLTVERKYRTVEPEQEEEEQEEEEEEEEEVKPITKPLVKAVKLPAEIIKLITKPVTKQSGKGVEAAKLEVKPVTKQVINYMDCSDMLDMIPSGDVKEIEADDCDDQNADESCDKPLAKYNEKYPPYDSLPKDKQDEQKTQIKALLGMLGHQESYDIFCILANTSTSFIDLANYYSREICKANGIDVIEWAKICKDAGPRQLRLGSLHYYAKQDNPTAYKKLFSKQVGQTSSTYKPPAIKKTERSKVPDKVRTHVYTSYERFDADKLLYVVRHFTQLQTTLMKPENAESQLQLYEAALERSRSGVLTVKWYQTNGKGRMFADQGISLVNMDRRTRHFIAGQYYYDIDVVNAHPVFLLHLCKQHDIKHKMLEKLVNNRDEFFASIIDSETKKVAERDIAKREILIATNAEPYKGNSRYTGKNIDAYRTEMAATQEAFTSVFAKEFTKHEEYTKYHHKRDKNFNGSFMNMKLCTFEHSVLMTMIEHYDMDGLLGPAYDGMMYPKDKSPKAEPDLTPLESLIYDKLDITVQLKIKPMDMGFTMLPNTTLPKHIDTVDNFTIQDYIDLHRGHIGMADICVRYNKNVAITGGKSDTIGYVYDESTALWIEADDNRICVWIISLLQDVAIEALEKEIDDKRALELGKILAKVRDLPNAKNVLGCISGLIANPSFIGKLDKERGLFPIANKLVLDCRTGKTIPRTREHYFTIESPVKLVSKEIVEKYQVEKYMSMLFLEHEKKLDDNSVTYYMQKLLGMCLTGIPTGKLYIWRGVGNNGKSSTMSIMQSILGEFMATTKRNFWVESRNEANKSASDHTAQYATVLKARLVQCNEFKDKDILNGEVYKNMVSGDTYIPYRLPNQPQDKKGFLPGCQNIATTNFIPYIDPSQKSDTKRYCGIMGPVNFVDKLSDPHPEFDDDDPDKYTEVLCDGAFAKSFLSGEGRDAFFTYLSWGCVKYFTSKYSMDTGYIDMIPALEEHAKVTIGQRDPLQCFIKDRVIVKASNNVSVTEFHKLLCDYSWKIHGTKIDYATKGLSSKMDKLKDKKINKVRTTHGMMYTNIDIVDEDGNSLTL